MADAGVITAKDAGNPFPLRLNQRWRVVDDGTQWILQKRKGAATDRYSGWRSRAFCRSRTGLLSRVGDLCGEIDPEAFIALSDLPEWHR